MIKFADERDERAWIAFAAGYRRTGYSQVTVNDDPTSAANFADRMLNFLRERRAQPEGGPYRNNPFEE